MSSKLPTQLAGDKVRKAIEQFSELLRAHPEKSRGELIAQVSQQCDLSPLECDFLQRQLKDS